MKWCLVCFEGKAFFIFFKTIFIITVVEQMIFYFCIPGKYFSMNSKIINSLVVTLLAFTMINNRNFYSYLVILLYLSSYIFLYYGSKNLAFSFLYVLVGYLLIQVNGNLLYHLLEVLFKIRVYQNIYTFLVIIFADILFYLIGIYFIYNMNKNKLILFNEKLSSKKMDIYFMLFYFIFDLAIWLQMKISGTNYWLYTILVVFLIITFCEIVYMLININNYQYEIKLLNANFNMEIEEENELKKFRHDYRNLLLTLNVFLQENRVEEAKELLGGISSYSEDILTKNFLKDLNKIKIIPIKNILFSKLIEAADKNIQVKLQINDEIRESGINIFNFVRILSNVIDNAIDACTEVEKNSFINIDIFEESKLLMIEVSNTYLNSHSYFLDELREQGFTTKSNHKGLGLAYLNDLAITDPQFQFNIEKTEEIFKVILCIKNK